MRKGIIGLSVVVSLLIFSRCSNWKAGSFVMPSWDTQLAAPIFNRSYTLEEILWKDLTTVSNGDTTFLNPVGSISVFSLFRTQPVTGVSFAGQLKIESAGINYGETNPALPAAGSLAAVPPIPSQNFTRDSSFENFQSATISSGTLNIMIKNDYPATIIVSNISVLDPSNNRFILSVPIPGNSLAPNQSDSLSQSLAGITLPNNPEVSFTYSSPGDPTPRIFQSDTVVEVSLNMSDIVVSSATGQIQLKDPISIATDTQTVNLGDFKTKFHGTVVFSPSTKLTLNINLSGGFPTLAHLVLTPANSNVNNGPIYADSVDQMIYPAQNNSVDFGSNFATALNSYSAATNTIPDEFIISGYAIVNPGPPYAAYADGTITNNDGVAGTGTLSIPLDLGITNGVFIDTSNSPVIKDSSTSTKLANVDSGEVTFEINNGLPLRLSFITQLIDTTTHRVIMTFPQDSIVIPAATQFNADGTVSSPMYSKNEVPLTHDQAMALGHSYMKFTFGMLTSPDQSTVAFTKNNTISLKVYANLVFKVDKNLVGK